MSKKIYVLDTNILLDNPDCLMESFDENDIVIPLTVIEELDNLKKTPGDTGYCARQALRNIESLRKDMNIHEGVPRNEEGSVLRVVPLTAEERKHYDSMGFGDKNDDNIILTALKVKMESKLPVILISNDTSVRIKSSLLDVPPQPYKDGTVKKETLDFKGYKDVILPLGFFGEFNELKGQFVARRMPPRMDLAEIEEYLDDEGVLINQFLLLAPPETHENMPKKEAKKLKVVYRYDGEELVKKSLQYKGVYGGLSGKNLEQSVALDVLLDDEVKVVALSGPSGSGKTILSIATCLTKMLKQKDTNYEKLILLKPTVSVSDDIGFLPGNVEEKLSHYMGSYMDNFKTLKKLETMSSKTTNSDSFDELKNKDMIEIESISFLRGRSLSDCLIIVDEVQNLSQNVIKTILTRVGNNCKIILLGDPDQIDRPFLSKYNNGLSYLIEKLKGQEFFAHVKFLHGVRSIVSKMSAELL
jgi:PhoH-like ATPase